MYTSQIGVKNIQWFICWWFTFNNFTSAKLGVSNIVYKKEKMDIKKDLNVIIL